MIEKMDGVLFDWLTWSGGGLRNLNVANRFAIIKDKANTIRKYAIGYCESESLICRPKVNEVAVMFFKDDNYFWTHLNKKEFNTVFKEKV